MMESVGVYGFCGCTSKNKMKCDSRWEVAATGVREFPILVQENKMGYVSAVFRYLSSKTDPGIKELLNYSFKIGVELP